MSKSWRERLKNPDPNMLADASDWNTCYIGENRIRLELLGVYIFDRTYSTPRDRLLALGGLFYTFIENRAYRDASYIADKIDLEIKKLEETIIGQPQEVVVEEGVEVS